MKYYIKAELQANMAGEEITRMIDPLRLSEIKKTDPNPVIKAYVVGHEGEHQFHLVGMGKRIVRWVKEMVGELTDKIGIGTPIFNRHNPATNDHTNREQIGEVVGKALKDIGNKITSVVAVYLKPKYKDQPLDVASIEADMGFDSDGTVLHPSLIEQITGIALGSSAVDTPGFPGATLLGAVQAFANQQGESMTKEEVIKAIGELKLSVTDLFSVDVVVADKTIAAKIKEDNKDTYSHAKRVETERDALREETTKLKNTHAAELATRDQTILQFKSKDRVTSLMTERKLPDQQQKFALKNWGSFKSDGKNDKEVDVDLNTFIDNQIKEFKEVAAMLGVKVEEPKQEQNQNQQQNQNQNTNQNQNHDQQPAVNNTLPGAALDPKQNNLIPQPITPGAST